MHPLCGSDFTVYGSRSRTLSLHESWHVGRLATLLSSVLHESRTCGIIRRCDDATFAVCTNSEVVGMNNWVVIEWQYKDDGTYKMKQYGFKLYDIAVRRMQDLNARGAVIVALVKEGR